jgi:hypothetical protein
MITKKLIEIDDELWRRVKAAAALRDLGVSEFTSAILREAVEPRSWRDGYDDTGEGGEHGSTWHYVSPGDK